MKQITISHRFSLATGMLLAFPAAYLILISLLKHALGIPYLFDTAQPLLESWGIKQSPGWNINLLILLGPMAAVVINLLSILRFEWYNEREAFSFKFSIEKHWWNMILVIFSGLLLATLFFYALKENCRCF